MTTETLIVRRLRDELAIREWWATTGKALGWTADNPVWRIQHRARLRLLLGMARDERATLRVLR